MRRFLDALYMASAWLAGLGMLGVLVMVSLMILGRLLGFNTGGFDSYAGFAMAGAGFLALAHTLKSGEHIRVTLVLGMLKGRWHKGLELLVLFIAVVLSGFLAFYSARLVWQSYLFGDLSTGIDATPMWVPQVFMALGTAIFFIAFVDEFMLELLGQRESSAQELHHE